MIIDARLLPVDDLLAADLCIVGGGAAGITLAHELRGSGLRVILAEAGGGTPDDDPSPVFGGEVIDPRHPPIDLYRSRCLGGTSSLWGGRCAPFEPIDLEHRAWVPHSGWPLTRAELDPAYARAAAYCDIGRPAWSAAEAWPGRSGGMIPGLVDEALRTDGLDRFSPPTHFGERYRTALAADGDVQVLLNANCLSLGLSPDARRIETLRMASLPGREFAIRARAVVLAAGGLETTRLLLLSDDVDGHGVGNGRDLVGRFYMTHLQGKVGVVRLRRDLDGVAHAYERDAEGVYCKRNLRIAEPAQRRRGLLNMSLRYEHAAIPDPSHGSGILSAMYLSRHLLKPEYARRLATCGLNGEPVEPGAAVLLRHLRNVVTDAPTLLRFAAGWFPKRKFVARRIPYVTLPNRDNSFPLDYYAEQAPHPDSRVMLTAARDPFGRRRLRVDWRTCALDHDSLAASYRLIERRLRASELGRLDYDERQLRREFSAIGGHHIGTTRMADTPAQGVVNTDGRVFGTDNLFIASASVFPTSGAVSPTFTIVALAVRLADHLRRTLTTPQFVRVVTVAAEET